MATSPDKETGFVHVNGVPIYYELAGAGPPLVLLHAGIADQRMWDAQFAPLAQRYRVLRYDMRGYGQTQMVAGSYAHRWDLRGLLDALAIERAHLLGCSLGGTTAIDFTLEQPERVRSLIAVACNPSGFVFDSDPPPQWDQLQSAWDKGNYRRVSELEVQIWVDGPYRKTDRVHSDIRDLVRAMNEIALQNEALELGAETPLEPPAAQRLHEIRVPTLLIAGALDRPMMVSAANYMEDRLAQVQKVVIPETAHLPNMEKPALFNRAVLDFLSNEAAGPAKSPAHP